MFVYPGEVWRGSTTASRRSRSACFRERISWTLASTAAASASAIFYAFWEATAIQRWLILLNRSTAIWGTTTSPSPTLGPVHVGCRWNGVGGNGIRVRAGGFIELSQLHTKNIDAHCVSEGGSGNLQLFCKFLTERLLVHVRVVLYAVYCPRTLSECMSVSKNSSRRRWWKGWFGCDRGPENGFIFCGTCAAAEMPPTYAV